jgi:diguanylate cyclase (GGDEF)-like protein/PAS domain S-box-containing protein
MTEVLGWRPEQLLGRPSTEFIHPEDQASAIQAWFEMISAPGETGRWEGRYQASDGSWRWVECSNVNRLDDESDACVVTTMKQISVEKISLAEELRARKQLLNRLLDAMPIGMFQIDTSKAITFTNDRLHVILGCGASASVDVQFAGVDCDDKALLADAIESVLGDEDVDEVEFRVTRPSEEDLFPHRVCVLSMRPLTDGAGLITGAVGCLTDVTEQVQLRDHLKLRANVDELTSCLNRSAILELLYATLENRKGRSGLGVVFVDLCGFKEVNDVYGHAAGDQVLQVASSRLRSVVRDGDQVGRFGGDEFLVVCPGIRSETIARELAERIRVALTGKVKVATGTVELKASIGVAWSKRSFDPDTLIAQADHAMYEAKRSGSEEVEIFATR